MVTKYRDVICFSLFFHSFFGGKLYYTGKLFGWAKIRQKKKKQKYVAVNEWNYTLYWETKYYWETIKE